MLSLLLILSGLAWPTSDSQSSKTSLVQITVPEKLGGNTNQKSAANIHLTYRITIEERTYILSLRKQTYLAPNFPVYSYNKWGSLQEDSSLVKGDCFYQGYVEYIPKSAVTLDICSGLRGFLLVENVSYGIEPMESSAVFEHMIYQIDNDKIEYPPLIEGYSEPQNVPQPYRILVKSDKMPQITMPTTLKIQIIIDKAMFDYMDSDTDVATEKMIHIFGLINTMFSRLKMTVLLSSLEVWSDKNKISTNGSADEVLQKFLSWKQTFLSSRSNNMAYLIIYKDHPNFVGATYHGMACDPKFSAGIILHPRTISLEAFSVVLAQLIGINLGLTYDDLYNCYCPELACIMNPGAIRSQGIKVFSLCSTDTFKQIISKPQFGCLRKQKLLQQLIYKQSACGNGVLEGGEECDCGLAEDCEHKKCCDAANCALIESAECGSGPCCNPSTCTIYERGHMCRKSRSECDFTEFCNGTSEFCMPDVRAADLEPCNNHTAYCLGGICRDQGRQCREIFGIYATNAPYVCVQEINFQNDKFGNCRRSCNFVHILCGKIVCSWGHSEVAVLRDYDFQYMYLAGHVCMSAHLRNTSRADDTYAQMGQACQEDKACENLKCTFIDEHPLKAKCSSEEQCKGHGVCNNNLRCHCDEGYAPPNCDEMVSSPGGSLDDGFWISPDKARLMILNKKTVPKKNGLLISFYVFLPLFIITSMVVLKWDKMKEFLHREEAVSGGSTTEDSNTNSTES